MTTPRNIIFQAAKLDVAGVETADKWAMYGVFGNDNKFWDGRIKSLGSYKRSMFSESALRGALQVGNFSVTLNNEDGALDYLHDYAHDGQWVYVAPFPFGSDDGIEIQDAVTEQALFSEQDVTFACRDVRHMLDKPLLTKRFLGTNAGAPLAGIEGTANDLKGKVKPMCMGRAWNLSPICVNTTKLIYQVDAYDGLIGPWLVTVYDKRAALTQGAVYVSQADMEAVAPAAGQFRVWPAGGCFRIASTPVGAITCDVAAPPLDPANNTAAYAPPATIGPATNVKQLIKRLVWYADVTTTGLLAAAFYGTASNQSGAYFDSEISILTAMEEVLGHCGGTLSHGVGPGTPAREGWYGTQLYDPDVPPFALLLAPVDLDGLSVIPNSLQQVIPSGPERGLPVWRVNLQWMRNLTVMSESDLAGVAAADKAFCRLEYRSLSKEDVAIKTKWPNAIELTVNTNYGTTGTAQIELDRLFDLFAVERRMFRISANGPALRAQAQFITGGPGIYIDAFQPAFVVRVTLPRYGFTAGKLMLVTDMDYDLDNDVYTLTIWG